MMCDGAGWHDERVLTIPDKSILALLALLVPNYPVERVCSTYAKSLRVSNTEANHRRQLRRDGSTSSQNRIVCEVCAYMDHEGG